MTRIQTMTCTHVCCRSENTCAIMQGGLPILDCPGRSARYKLHMYMSLNVFTNGTSRDCQSRDVPVTETSVTGTSRSRRGRDVPFVETLRFFSFLFSFFSLHAPTRSILHDHSSSFTINIELACNKKQHTRTHNTHTQTQHTKHTT